MRTRKLRLLLLLGILLAGSLLFWVAPMRVQGPQLVTTTPADGARITDPDAPIELRFSQVIWPFGLDERFALEPPVPMRAEWRGLWVVLWPQSALADQTDYTLTIDSRLSNAAGRPAARPAQVRFFTTHQPRIEAVLPAPDADTIARGEPVSVRFDRPIVSEEELEASLVEPGAAPLPQPITLVEAEEPGSPLVGVGRWVDPQTFNFAPASGLRPGTTYIVSVARALDAEGRLRLDAPFSWRFTTAAEPLVLDVRPMDGAVELPLDTTITVSLAPEADQEAIRAAFQLVSAADGLVVPGQLRVTPAGFDFVPAEPLTLDTTYEARLQGLRTIEGDVRPMVTWRFQTRGKIRIDQVTPRPATVAASLATPISVRFDRPVVERSGPGVSPIQITPSLPGEGRWIDPRTYVYSPTLTLTPRTRYAVQVVDTLADPEDVGLQESFSWSFTAEPLEAQLENWELRPGEPFVLRFNTVPPLDQLNLQLTTGDGQPVTFDATVAGQNLFLALRDPLQRGESYTLQVGSALFDQNLQLRLRALDVPRLLLDESQPTDGEQDVTPRSVAFGGNGIVLTFNVPMDEASLLRNVTITPPPARLYTFSSPPPGQPLRPDFPLRGTVLYLDPELAPSTDYELQVGPGALDRFGVPLGQSYNLRFRTGFVASTTQIVTQVEPEQRSDEEAGPKSSSTFPAYHPSRLSFDSGRFIATYNAYTPTFVALRYVNVPSVAYRVHTISIFDAEQMLVDENFWRSYQPADNTIVREGQRNLPGEPDKQWLEVLNLGNLSPGLYQMYVSQPGGRADFQTLVVSRYALTIKRSENDLFVWAVDQRDGTPVANLPLVLSYLVDRQPRRYPLGQTGADGVLRVALPTIGADVGVDTRFVVYSPEGERFTFASTSWDRDIAPVDFGLLLDVTLPRVTGNIYTDRPLYSAGQQVFVKGMIRVDRDRVYQLPARDRLVRVALLNPRGVLIGSQLVPLNAIGTFTTSFSLDRLALVGSYTVVGRLEPAGVVTVDQDERGEQAAESADVNSTFLVTDYRRPSFRVTLTPAQTRALPGERVLFSLQASYFTGEPVPDAVVRWRVFESPLPSGPQNHETYVFGDEALVEPAAGQRLIAEGRLRTGGTGAQQFTINTGSSRQPRRLAVIAEVTDLTARLANVGDAQVDVVSGAYQIGIKTERRIVALGAATSVELLTLDGADRPLAGQRLDVALFHRQWLVAREQGAEGRFYWSSIISDTLVSTQTLVGGPEGRVSFTWAPPESGAYLIRATGRDGANNEIVTTRLLYSYAPDATWAIDDSIQLELVADRERYRPGDVAQILIPAPYSGMTALVTVERNTIISHQTVALSGTTGLISIPITAEHTPNIYVGVTLLKAADGQTPFPEFRAGMIELKVPIVEQQLGVELRASPEDPAPGSEVRFDLKVTDSLGAGRRAEVSLALVDDRLLELARTLDREPTPTFTDSLFERRPLGVATSSALVQLADRVVVQIHPGNKGGGGVIRGPTFGPGIIPDELLLRHTFLETAYWEPALMTDENGQLQLRVRLPDNLTTWRLVVRAVTADTRFGQETLTVTTKLPVFVEPILPARLIAGDRAVLRARVQNSGETLLESELTLALGHGDRLRLLSAAAQAVRVPPGEATVVAWEVEAAAPGTTAVTMALRGADALRTDLAVEREVVAITPVGAGSLPPQGDVELPITPPPPGTQIRELLVEVQPGPSALLRDNLVALAAPRYGNSEELVSSFLPQLRAANRWGESEPPAAAFGRTLQQLYRLQSLDGGWGWWDADRLGHPFLSAYVVQGLVEARAAGYAVDPDVLGRALGYLETNLSGLTLTADAREQWRADTRAYTLYVLGLAGRSDPGRTLALYTQRERLSNAGKAYLLLALDVLDDRRAEVAVLAGELAWAARPTTDALCWGERTYSADSLSSEQRTTAVVMEALQAVDQGNPLLPAAARCLLDRLQPEAASSSYATGQALMALIGYLTPPSAEAPAAYDLLVDGVVVQQVRTAGVVSVRAGTQVTLRSRSNAALAYTVWTREYAPGQAQQATGRGVSVERRYLPVDRETLLPGLRPINEAAAGDLVIVQLTLTLAEPARYLVVEDQLPAGLESIELIAESANLFVTPPAADPSAPSSDLDVFSYVAFSRTGTAVFATSIPAGTYRYHYLTRAVTPGVFTAPGTQARQSYAPALRARSSSISFRVSAPR